MAVDPVMLLLKYMALARSQEGVDAVLEPLNEPRHICGDLYLSVEEQKELYKIAEEAMELA